MVKALWRGGGGKRLDLSRTILLVLGIGRMAGKGVGIEWDVAKLEPLDSQTEFLLNMETSQINTVTQTQG